MNPLGLEPTPDVIAKLGTRRWLLAAALLLIAAVTLVPGRGSKPTVGAACVLCGEFGAPDLVLNVILFIPLGVALGMYGTRPLRAMGVALMVSAAIETLQFFLPGRSSTLRDVLTNALGGGAGALIALELAGWIAPGRRAVVLLWTATGTAIVLVVLTGLLLRPSPPDGLYVAGWVPRKEYLAPWNGTVTAVSVDSRPLPPGRVRDPEALRRAIASGPEIRIIGTEGDRTRHPAGILTISSDEEGREVLLVGAVGDALVVRSRRLSAWLRLKAPDVRFVGMLATRRGAPIDITVRGDLMDRLCVRVNGQDRCAPRPAAGSAWTLFLSGGGAPRFLRIVMEALTFFTLAFPVALLAGSVSAGQARLSLLVFVAGIGVAAPAVFLAFATVWEWGGAAVAVLVARALHRRLIPPAGTGV